MDVKENVRTTSSRLEISFPEIDFINSFTAMSRTPASAPEEARIMSMSSRLLGCPDAGPIFINISILFQNVIQGKNVTMESEMTSCSTASFADSSASDKVSATFCSIDGCRGCIRDNKRRAVRTICASNVGSRTLFISEVVSAKMTVDGMVDVAINFSSSVTEASSANLNNSELIEMTKRNPYLSLKHFTNGQSIFSLPDHKVQEVKSLTMFLQAVLILMSRSTYTKI